MDKTVYFKIEAYMHACIAAGDGAHDAQHIYRVLGLAGRLAQGVAQGVEEPVDDDVLTAACLLHDIGRPEQFQNPAVCHAEVGSKKAYAFLLALGWREEAAAHVRDCVLTHRTRSDRAPATIEAKLLHDADKLDVSGAMGVARTLCYQGKMGLPLYSVGEDGRPVETDGDEPHSFLQEYHYKLAHIGEMVYTKAAKEIATRRLPAATAFYRALIDEIAESLNDPHLRRLL